jgi:hypothetical protein
LKASPVLLVVASAATVAPGLNTANVIASLYTRLASARAANRMDAMVCYERMIDHLKRKEEEDLEACLNYLTELLAKFISFDNPICCQSPSLA